MRILKLATIWLLLVLWTLPLGCGGGDDGVTPPDQSNDLSAITLTVSSSAPMAQIFVQGLPTTKAVDDYRVVFLDSEGADSFDVPLVIPEAGLPWFLAPFHPLLPNSGGPVSLQVSGGQDRSPTQDLDLGALPSTPGKFADYVAALRQHIDQRAQREGSSFADLAATEMDAVEARLLPLKFAQSFVDDPTNPHCLARIIDGSSDVLDAEQKQLLDNMFGYAHIDSVVQADVDHMTGSPARVFTWYGDDSAKAGCINMGPIVATDVQLSDAMQKAFEAKIATDPNGNPAKILNLTGQALTAASFVPALGAVAAVAGAGLYAFQTSREYYANTYPSSFVSLEFTLDRDVLPEDEPDFTRWSNVKVVAKSEGWTADKAIFNGVMQLVGAGLSASHVGEIQGSSFLRDDAMFTVGNNMNKFLDTQPDGVVEFCSQRWGVDITDLPYSRGEAVIGRVTVDTDFREIRPVMVGADIIRVRAVSDQFGFQTISADLPIETKAILVRSTPDVILVRNPGVEVVFITTTIEYADQVTLDWRAEAGSWNDNAGDETNGPKTRPLLTPADEQAYPFDVVVESTSRQGLRASGLPPRRDTVKIRLQTGEIIVSPSEACVPNGETETFIADVLNLDNTAVTWSLEAATIGGTAFGSVSQAGVYTAPASGSGEALVVATSQEDPEIIGRAYVEAGTCACSWTLEIAGGGTWSGDNAGHVFAGQFNPFSLTFGFLDQATDGSGNVQVYEVNGPTAGVLGTWDCHFSWVTDSQVWVSTNTEGTASTMVIEANSEAQVKSTITGTLLTAVGGEDAFQPFTLTIRSGDVIGSGGVPCGE